jgi:Fe-S-cluster containining protein
MEKDKPQDEKTSEEQALVQLERQIERGSLFTHTIVSQNADRTHQVESVLYGLVDVLIQKGVVTQEEVLQSSAKVRQEMEEKGQTIGPGIALRIEGEGNKKDAFVPVNCSERLHICKAVCCRLHFALSAEEVESGKIKWDLGAPYYIRQESTGHCHHLDPNGKGCSIYADCPGVCRKYSCAQDERIWKDFANMVFNQEWVDEHLAASKPRLVTAQMLPQKIAYQQLDAPSRSKATPADQG